MHDSLVQLLKKHAVFWLRLAEGWMGKAGGLPVEFVAWC